MPVDKKKEGSSVMGQLSMKEETKAEVSVNVNQSQNNYSNKDQINGASSFTN